MTTHAEDLLASILEDYATCENNAALEAKSLFKILNYTPERIMTQDIGARALANMEAVLEDHCQKLPNGGDHEHRKFIAERLIACMAEGKTALGDLHAAARLAETKFKNSA